MKEGKRMRCEYCPNNPERFATNLRRDLKTKNLMWDNAQGQDVIMIQTPFGENAVSRIVEICEVLEKMTVLPSKYTEIINGIWVKFVTAVDKARNNGCALNGEASTYTVLSYVIEDNVLKIYEPKDSVMISSFCDIPLELHVNVEKITRMEGFFKKKEVETGFYSMQFPTEFRNGYLDGSLLYKISDFEIPVTRGIVEQGIVYIKSDISPVLISKNKGIKLV